MWNEPTKERLAKIPKLYQTENIPLKDKLIHLHFFIAGCDWYIAEYDGEDLFWGFAVLNNDLQNEEWGYISLSELKSIKIDGWQEINCELEELWRVRRAIEIEKIRIAHGWLKENNANDEELDEVRDKEEGAGAEETTDPYKDSPFLRRQLLSRRY